MLASNLTFDDASGDDVTYNQVPTRNLGEVLRTDPSKPITEPRTLAIRHSLRGRGALASDNHNVLFSETVKDSAGVPWTGTVSLTMNVPRNGVITEGHMKDLVSNLVDLLTNGAITGIADTSNIGALLRGEA